MRERVCDSPGCEIQIPNYPKNPNFFPKLNFNYRHIMKIENMHFVLPKSFSQVIYDRIDV